MIHFRKIILVACASFSFSGSADVGVGAKPVPGAEVVIDGSRNMLVDKWTYWEGPGFKSSLPIKWKIVEDPVDGGTCVMTDDPVAAGGKYGTADIVTKKKYGDFRLHIEFLIMKTGGNSGVYLQNRLHTKAGALERARVARELHDGVIQSLIGVEMQLEVLRGQEALRDTPTGGELVRLRNLVRDEVLNLRDLMQQMRPAEFDPDELLDHFADMVQRFGRDTGISARFVTDLKEVALARHVCFELVRIVQEGLANIRKHSAATHAVVRFGVDVASRASI